MMLKKLPVIAASAALSFWACGDDSSIANPDSGANFPAATSSSSDAFGIESSSGILDIDVEIWSSSNTAPVIGTSSSSNALPGNVVSSSSVMPNVGVSSSSTLLPGNGTSSSSNVVPVVSSSSNNAVPGSSESGDNENDNEDARTLDGTQILLKLAGTSATVENNNGCVEIADKSATITCPGAYYVTGESSDFQVVVNTPGAENEGNTGIYLHNATIKSSNAPILVKNADKTVLHLVKGTTNVVEDGNGNHLFVKVNGAQDTAKAAIYSRDDLNIKGAGTDVIRIRGVERLHKTEYSVIPDQIEAGTFMMAAAATRGDITVKNVIPKHLESISAKLQEIGCKVEESDDAVRVIADKVLSHTQIKTLPYPGFPTDMQPQITVVLALSNGSSIVTESIFENRFKYVDELTRMGASIKVEGNTAIINGVSKYTGAHISAPDLRAGAALVIAALAAEGMSVIDDIAFVERGYEDFDVKLRGLGAVIEKVEDEKDIRKFRMKVS